MQEAETTDGRPSKKMDVSTPVAPHIKKEDFSVSPSDHKMQQAKELKMQQAKKQQVKEQQVKEQQAKVGTL